uniref:Peptidase M20 domain containing 1 n=2 Tax=Callorhinchus milii TaxID=7868 RepID=A0A4W3GKN8_CALMI
LQGLFSNFFFDLGAVSAMQVPGWLRIVFLAVSLLCCALLLRTLSAGGGRKVDRLRAASAADFTPGENERLLSNLRAAVQIPTVSLARAQPDTAAMEAFRDYLPQAFPGVFSSDLVRHEIIANYSHLFTVRGSDPGLRPYILTAHLDVVPVAEEKWDFPPFSGEESDGYLYGRGTLDDKASAVGILQALEFLLNRGYVPRRAFYVAIGHDEEVGGDNGARNIAATLESRGVKLSFLLDEGSVILDHIIPGLKKPVAVIAVTEKGQALFSLKVNTQTGHSSMPMRESSIGILASAVSRLEKKPMPRMFGLGPELAMFEQLGPEMSFPLNIIMANLWLFAPIISRTLEKNPSMNALVRTTTAVTEFHAGIKPNVLPPTANATLNFRIHPAHSVQGLIEEMRYTIDDDRVKIDLLYGFDPLPTSPHDELAFGYQIIRTTVENVFPEVFVIPGLSVANTDTRHYQHLTEGLYRFVPLWITQEDTGRIHGPNERISVKNYEEIVRFYFHLIQNSDLNLRLNVHSSGHEL